MNGEDALNERILALEKMFLALRAADMEAVRVAREDVKERMAGFPAEYAKKAELEQIRDTAIRLDRNSLSREAYDQQHKQLEEDIETLLSKDVFEATVREWTVWRRNVDNFMAESAGSAGAFRRIGLVIGAVATVVTVIVSTVVLFANNTI
jgi:hypothetical protein